MSKKINKKNKYNKSFRMNPDMPRDLFYTFLFVGIALLLYGVFLASELQTLSENPNYVPTLARISHIDRAYERDDRMSHTVYVDYEYNNVKYTDIKLNAYSTGMAEGKYINIYIEKNNPYKTFSSSANGAVIFIFMGLVFLTFTLFGDKLIGDPNSGGRKLMPGLLFVFIGLLFLPFSISKSFDSDIYQKLDAKIVNVEAFPDISNEKLETDTVVYVDYEYNNKTYKNIPLPYYSSDMLQKKNVEIIINKATPYSVESNLHPVGKIFFGVFSVIFIIIGLLALKKDSKTNKLSSWLHNPIPMFKFIGKAMIILGLLIGIYGFINKDSSIFSGGSMVSSKMVAINGKTTYESTVKPVSNMAVYLYVTGFFFFLGSIFAGIGHLGSRDSALKTKNNKLD